MNFKYKKLVLKGKVPNWAKTLKIFKKTFMALD